MRRSFAVVPAFTALLALTGSSAVAMKAPGPDQFVVDEIHDVFGPFPVGSCKDGVPHEGPDADFLVMYSGEFHLVHTHQPVGKSGVVKHQTWVWGVDTFTNSEDPSKVATGTFGSSDVGHLRGDEGEETGIVRIHGLFWHVVAPGFGVILKEAGIITLDLDRLPDDPFVSFKGVSNLDFGGETDRLVCAALS